MATRLYVHALASQPKAPAIAPAFDAAWEKTQATRVLLTARSSRPSSQWSVPSTTALAGQGANPSDNAIAQAISEPLKAQTIQGNIQGFFRAAEGAATDNYNPAIIIRVIAPDGTVRGTVLSVLGGGTEFPTTSGSIAFPAGGPLAGTPVVAQEGDYLVIELGFTETSTSVASGSMVLGYSRGNLDFAAEGDTALKNGYIEFDTDIAFQDDAAALHPYYFPPVAVGNGYDYVPQLAPPPPAAGAPLVIPAAIVATSDVTATVVRLRPVTPAAITATSAVTATVVRTRPVTPAGITATSDVTATVSRARPVVPAGIVATSNVSASVSRGKSVSPAGIVATSDVTASVVRLRPVTPAAITSTSNVSATVVRRRPVTPAAITASSAVTASVVRLRPVAGASIVSTSNITATITAIHRVAPASIVATSDVTASVSGGGAVATPLRERDLLGVGL